MNWKKIIISDDGTRFILDGKMLFGKVFTEVLKFHAPGIAAVSDESGAYHIDESGAPLYTQRHERTFGYYCNRAAVINEEGWFHLDEKGLRAYQKNYNWTGNFQEDLCTVRDSRGSYSYIHPNGEKAILDSYLYAGDFKDGIACVKTESGVFRHIRNNGTFLHNKAFKELGVFHKNYATAQGESGWFHIHKDGSEAYSQRFAAVEPFYNGFALVSQFDGMQGIIDEQGKMIHTI